MIKRAKELKEVIVSKPVAPITEEEMIAFTRQYKQLALQKAALEKASKELRVKIDGYFETIAKDTRGNRYFQAGDLLLKREVRKKITLNVEKAEKFFKEIGEYENVVKFEPVFDEDAIDQLVANNVIDVDDLKGISDEAVSYATTFVKEVEEVEEGADK